jgi:methylmalonyl-CoA mutase N-terminal domain/subunit
MGDGTSRPISQIRIGDQVLAVDPDTGEQGPHAVVNLWVHQDDLNTVEMTTSSLHTTEDQVVWNDADQQWEELQLFEPGDWLAGPDSRSTRLVGFDHTTRRSETAYNLGVNTIDSYVVLTTDRSNTQVLQRLVEPGQCSLPNQPPERESRGKDSRSPTCRKEPRYGRRWTSNF